MDTPKLSQFDFGNEVVLGLVWSLMSLHGSPGSRLLQLSRHARLGPVKKMDDVL